MVFGGNFKGVREGVRKRRVLTAHGLEKAPGVVFDVVVFLGAVGHALGALVAPAEGGLDAVAGVVCEGERDGAGGGDRKQVAVAQAVGADHVFEGFRKARSEGLAAEEELGVEEREAALFGGEHGAGGVAGVAHAFGDDLGHAAGFGGVVAQVEHDQCVAKAGESDADAALALGFALLLFERPGGDVQGVVEHSGGDGAVGFEGGEVEACAAAVEGVEDVAGEVEEPRQQHPKGGRGCSAQGLVARMVSQ